MARGGKRDHAGRKPGTTKADGLPTKVVRVSTELETADYQRLPELIATIRFWEDEMMAEKERGGSMRTYAKLSHFLDDVHSLGY